MNIFFIEKIRQYFFETLLFCSVCAYTRSHTQVHHAAGEHRSFRRTARCAVVCCAAAAKGFPALVENKLVTGRRGEQPQLLADANAQPLSSLVR